MLTFAKLWSKCILIQSKLIICIHTIELLFCYLISHCGKRVHDRTANLSPWKVSRCGKRVHDLLICHVESFLLLIQVFLVIVVFPLAWKIRIMITVEDSTWTYGPTLVTVTLTTNKSHQKERMEFYAVLLKSSLSSTPQYQIFLPIHHHCHIVSYTNPVRRRIHPFLVFHGMFHTYHSQC